MIKTHAILGEELCRPLVSMKKILPAIRHHHERWDGSGFPDRLAGDDIPIIARILAIVGSFDAIVSVRPYRDRRSVAATIDLMQEERYDGQWDSELDLRTSPAGERPFFLALQGYLDGFRQNYGIQVEVSIGPGVDDTNCAGSASAAVPHPPGSLFQRPQARRDGLPAGIVREGRRPVRMSIRDNGRGFDPARAAGEGHFGLRFMRERAEQLGGTLRVDSAPGEGTCVTVELPVEGADYA